MLETRFICVRPVLPRLVSDKHASLLLYPTRRLNEVEVRYIYSEMLSISPNMLHLQMPLNVNMIIESYQEAYEEQVVALWRSCCLVVPQNDPHKDIQSKLQVQPKLFFVGLADGLVVAALMAGYEGHRGWLNYLAVSPQMQRQGLGRQMVQFAEAALRDLGCPKINLQIRASNKAVVEFYRNLGFSEDDVISMGKRL